MRAAVHALMDLCPKQFDVNSVGEQRVLVENERRLQLCNERGTIYVISSDFSDRMTTQSMRLMVLLSEHF